MVDGRWLTVLWWFSVSPCPFLWLLLIHSEFQIQIPADLPFRFPSIRRIFINPTLVKPYQSLGNPFQTSIRFHSILSLSLYPCLFLSVSPPFCLSPSRSINSLNSIRITLHYVSCPLRDNGKVRVSICQIANQIGWKCAPPHPPHPPPNGSSYFGRIRPAVKWHRHRIATLLIVSSAW